MIAVYRFDAPSESFESGPASPRPTVREAIREPIEKRIDDAEPEHYIGRVETIGG
jgi:hypothetical protein